MTNKSIIIDAAHKEETRVVVLENGILQDFDREAISVQKIKGNIYLGKVTRVEPSLQAAFIDFGSQRHGFLPFGDIHPAYYNLPDEQKQKLRESYCGTENKSGDEDGSDEDAQDDKANATSAKAPKRNAEKSKSDSDDATMTTGSYSVEDETENYKGNIHGIHRKYNIQDVIKPGQLILIQATKEERGNKGASMTTYISLAGKYCVLMANTPNKGGVSRKVENYRDRKILKAILEEVATLPDRSVIIRTAGVGKKPEEIKRDNEYLNKLWESIEDAMTTSKAPTFIHGEDDVIKRCLRDVYNEEISEVVIEGKEAFEKVDSFIKMTMPAQKHNIKLYEDRVPVFNKYRVEQQISALYQKDISLKSGGSIVIDHTEALVAVDVNSGKSTREANVEETAYQTNLEAAKEIAKQLRLRDLAGLIVIDFIDMYDQKHRRHVERTLRDELQNDRARIQLGRISIFGLMELSRQRLGASLFETITEPCQHCDGTGFVRSVEILAVAILRSIRYACTDRQTGVVYVNTTPEVISYMANFKRRELLSTEKNYNVHVFLHPSEDVGGNGYTIKKRKGLSSEERREIEMEVATGKVNQLDLERKYLDGDVDENSSKNDNSREEKREPRNNNRRNNDRRGSGNNRNNRNRRSNNNRRNNSRNSKAQKGIVKSIMGIFK